MKKKITRFLLMITFAIAPVSCSVDAGGGVPHNCSVSFLSHIYTEEEQSQVRQNLIGRYQNVTNNGTLSTMLHISNNRILDNFDGREYTYTINFGTQPLIFMYDNEGYQYVFYIDFEPNSYTEIRGIQINETDGSTLLFRKLENNEIPAHDEL